MSVLIKYFVHGTTTDNEKKLATGWLAGELSEKGIVQAKDLAKVIANEKFDIVYCSDLKRAVDSAKIDFENRDIKIVQDARLRECNYGDLDGKDSKMVLYFEHIEKAFPNGECLKDVEKRIRSFLDDLKKNYDGQKVAIVAHRAPQLAVEVVLQNKTWQEAIESDWRISKEWKPGWIYEIK